jgi:predicted kinase
MPYLLIFDGLPGTGKSTLAEAAGRALNITVLARDWIAASLVAGDYLKPGNPNDAAHDVMAAVAGRQFVLGQSVIFDCVVGSDARRQRWTTLAHDYTVDLHVIQCICSDEPMHRARIATRQRGIPGWGELTWQDVQGVRAHYTPWDGAALTLDAANPVDQNTGQLLAYLRALLATAC